MLSTPFCRISYNHFSGWRIANVSIISHFINLYAFPHKRKNRQENIFLTICTLIKKSSFKSFLRKLTFLFIFFVCKCDKVTFYGYQQEYWINSAINLSVYYYLVADKTSVLLFSRKIIFFCNLTLSWNNAWKAYTRRR